MAFEIIKAETIVARMITWFAGVQSQITDFLPGSKIRTEFEAIAVEIEYQYAQFYGAIKKAIAVSIYTSFGFTLRPPIPASGYVTFIATSAPTQDIIISTGSQVSSTSQTYVTTAAAVLIAGATTVSVPVVCVSAGTIGNADISVINTLKTAIAGIASVDNPAAVINGLDWETEEQRQARFQKFIASLSRATDAANEYGATTVRLLGAGGDVIEYVADAKVVGPPVTAVSHFNLYIWNGIGVASSDLVAETQKIIDGYLDANNNPVAGYKAAGDVCTVASVQTVVGNVSLEISPMPGAIQNILRPQIIRTVSVYIQSLPIGQGFVLNELIRRVKNLAGVSDLTVIGYPTAYIDAGHILVPGTIDVVFP
jgi:hypothetical protein